MKELTSRRSVLHTGHWPLFWGALYSFVSFVRSSQRMSSHIAAVWEGAQDVGSVAPFSQTAPLLWCQKVQGQGTDVGSSLVSDVQPRPWVGCPTQGTVTF